MAGDGPAPAARPSAGVRLTAVTAVSTVKVIHPTAVRKVLLAAVRERGGFPSVITDQRLVLKVPPEQVPGLMKLVADQGDLISKSLSRKDLTEEIAQLEGRLRSKSEILARLRGFIDDSNVQATLQIEKSMLRLVSELELVRGRLRVQSERTQWAVLTVHLSFHTTDKVRYVHSPFKWLNSVDLNRFLGDF